MTLDTIRGALFPTLEEEEPHFREEVERVALNGVRAIAAVCRARLPAAGFVTAAGLRVISSQDANQ
jgi:hypothetical protein